MSKNSSICSEANGWRSLVINEWPTHGSYQKRLRLDDYNPLGSPPVILGIHDGHTASACVLMEGKIVSAVEEISKKILNK